MLHYQAKPKLKSHQGILKNIYQIKIILDTHLFPD